MKGDHRKAAPRTARNCAIEVWDGLGRPPVGQTELRAIQRAITKRFGGTADSPASLARVLADEGAELRHPEVIECDANWRAAQLSISKSIELKDHGIFAKRLTLKQAETLIRKSEQRRGELDATGDKSELRKLRDSMISAKQAALLLARDRALDSSRRAEQAEIAQWMSVWLQTPNLFEEWIQLRRRAAEFQRRFATDAQRPREK